MIKLTEKDYCDYELSHIFWQMGLEASTDYDGHSILLYEALKFLREQVGLHIEITYCSPIGWYEYNVKEADKIVATGSAFKTYEEALSTAIHMAVEYIKENQYDSTKIDKFGKNKLRVHRDQ